MARRSRAALDHPASGRRRTRPYEGKFSLFQLGLRYLQQALMRAMVLSSTVHLEAWNAPAWQQQLIAHHAHAFVFAH